MKQNRLSRQARLKPFIEGLVESWDVWLEEQKNKRIGFWGLSGEEFALAEANITKWGYTFSADTFNQPMRFWQKRVAGWFNIEAYFNYRELEQASVEFKQLMHQDQPAVDTQVASEVKPWHKQSSPMSVIKLQKPASSTIPAELSASVLKQLKTRLDKVLQAAKKLLIKQIIKNVTFRTYFSKSENVLTTLIQAQEAADAQTWIFNRQFEADTFYGYLGKTVGEDVLEIGSDKRKRFIQESLKLMKSLWPLQEKPKEAIPTIQTEVAETVAAPAEQLIEKPGVVLDSGLGSEESSDTESNPERGILPTSASGILVALEQAKVEENSAPQFSPITASKKVFFRSLERAKDDTTDQQARFDQAQIETDLAEFKDYLLNLSDSSIFEQTKARGMASLETFKRKEVGLKYHPDKAAESENNENGDDQSFVKLYQFIEEAINTIEKLRYCSPEENGDARLENEAEVYFAKGAEELYILGRKGRGQIKAMEVRLEGRLENVAQQAKDLAHLQESVALQAKQGMEEQQAVTEGLARQIEDQAEAQRQQAEAQRQQAEAQRQQAEAQRQQAEEKAAILQRQMEQQAEAQRQQAEVQSKKIETLTEQNQQVLQMLQGIVAQRENGIGISPLVAPNAVLFPPVAEAREQQDVPVPGLAEPNNDQVNEPVLETNRVN